MANPVKIDAEETVLAASTTPFGVLLNPAKEYTLTHRRLNESGGIDEADIFIITGLGDASIDHTAGLNKLKLISELGKVIGPLVDRISFISKSGAPCFEVSPSGVIYGV